MLKLMTTIPNDGSWVQIMIFSGLSTYREVNEKVVEEVLETIPARCHGSISDNTGLDQSGSVIHLQPHTWAGTGSD